MTYFTFKNGFITGEPSWEGLGPHTSPVQSVPYEILSKIFIICSKIEALSPMKITSVCRLWRETILATPLAWTYICSAGIEAGRISAEKYSRFLQLSGPYMLFVKVDHLLNLCLSGRYFGAGHETCACLKIKLVFLEYSNRLRCLYTDISWLADTYSTIQFPNLEHLTLSACTNSRRLDMSRFPKLWHLRVPYHATDLTRLDFANPHRPHLRHLHIFVHDYSLWAPFFGMFTSSLRTLVLGGWFLNGQRSEGKLKFPQLRSLIIYDASETFSEQDQLLELSVPRLIYFLYRSHHKALLPGIIWDHTELVHIRTTQLLNLCDYPSLRILQISDPDCKYLADIASQLKSDGTLCPQLHKIEAKITKTSLSIQTYTNVVYRQIYDRNKKAGSNITLVVGQEWLTSPPIPPHECEYDAPCYS